MFKRVSGTKDILPNDVLDWQFIERAARDVFARYNYLEIRPPLIEDISLFNRSLGESAEIVQKQMFVINNKDEQYALRPEGTASVVRAYVENNLDKIRRFSKLFYLGPMFRLERPQKGRLRQFHHIGCECIGSMDAALDVEVISVADMLLRAFSVTGHTIKLNTLGCPDDKKLLAAKLRDALKDKTAALCEDCKVRYNQNVLRVLDCKQDGCRQIVASLTLHETNVCSECAAHFAAVRAGLDSIGIAYTVSPHLVRGLDYYTRTVFEISHGGLGAQDAIGAGGRYDTLVKELGGPDVGAIGFAFGVERILLVSQQLRTPACKKMVFVLPLGDEAKKQSIGLLHELRDSGIACDTDYEGKSMKGALRAANDADARYVVIIGENELAKKTVMLKDMIESSQTEIPRDTVVATLKNTINMKEA